jgi:ankyrin repeat protein
MFRNTIADKNIPLFLAAKKGDILTLSRLIEKKEDLNKQDCHGNTALSHTLINKNLECAKLLLETDVNEQLPQDAFSLNLAIDLQDIDLITLLLLQGGVSNPYFSSFNVYNVLIKMCSKDEVLLTHINTYICFFILYEHEKFLRINRNKNFLLPKEDFNQIKLFLDSQPECKEKFEIMELQTFSAIDEGTQKRLPSVIINVIAGYGDVLSYLFKPVKTENPIERPQKIFSQKINNI